MIPGHATAKGALRFAARFPLAAQHDFFRAAQGRPVSSLGIGTYLGEADDATDRAYTAAIAQAVRGGVNVIDTAINYRHQRSERAIAAALAELAASGAAARDELLLCTKAGFLTPGAIPAGIEDVAGGMHCMAPAFLEDQIDRSRANLGVETLDVFYLHNPETQLQFVAPAEFEARLHAAFDTLERLAAAGKILFYGAATWNGFRVREGQPGRLFLPRILNLVREAAGDDHHFRFLQLPVNLGMPEAFTLPHHDVDGQPATLLEIAARAGVTVVASAALLQARLATGLPADLAAKLPGPATDAARALQFARSTPGVTTALAGMSRPGHVAENLALASFPPATIEQYLNLFQGED